MLAMLNERELANLHIALEAPLAVIDILDQENAENSCISEEDHMALSILFSEMNPLQALISIACCMQHITKKLSNFVDQKNAVCVTLSLQADFILNDYAPLWLKTKNAKKSETEDCNWQPEIQEDFEALADILTVTQDSIPDNAHNTLRFIASLCGLMADHATARAEMLSIILDEAFFGTLTPIETEQSYPDYADTGHASPRYTGTKYMGTNIIMFPRQPATLKQQ